MGHGFQFAQKLLWLTTGERLFKWGTTLEAPIVGKKKGDWWLIALGILTSKHWKYQPKVD